MGEIIQMPEAPQSAPDGERLDPAVVVHAVRVSLLAALALLHRMDAPEGRRRVLARCPTTRDALGACGWTGLVVEKGTEGPRVLQEYQYGVDRWVPWRFAVLDDSPGERIDWWWGEFNLKDAVKPALTDRPREGSRT